MLIKRVRIKIRNHCNDDEDARTTFQFLPNNLLRPFKAHLRSVTSSLKKMRSDYLSSVYVKHQAAQQRLFTQLPGFVSQHSKDFSHSCLVSEQLLRSNPSSTKHVALQIQFGTKHRRKILASHSAASGLRQDFFSR